MNKKLLYWIPTGLLCLMMIWSASMYVFKYDMISGFFTELGFPLYIIYPLAILKVLGVIALLTNKSRLLTEWAYAGFFFDFALAASAHLNASDGQEGMAFAAIILLFISRYFLKLRNS